MALNPARRSPARTAPFAVASNGQRFLINTLVDNSGGAPLTLVLNWTSALKK